MNILHHKSWHVRNKDNIERVRRDEAKAAEEEKEKLRKIALAEQEARTDLLRQKARKRRSDDPFGSITQDTDKQISSSSTSTVTTDITDTPPGNINFFKHLETGEEKQGKNIEHEEEKKAEKEKWEKDIGLLTYLGQSAVETQDEKPWYLSGRKKQKDRLDPVTKDRKLKDDLDPLNTMKSYIHKTKHNDKKHKHKESGHKHKKHKKEKERQSNKQSSTKTIEMLRNERLKREAQERQRTHDLLTGGQGHLQKEKEEPVNERKRGYNSVYNPDLITKKSRHSYEKYTDL
ncbi:Leukocyte receptor cluster member 1 [Mactra antiquata]